MCPRKKLGLPQPLSRKRVCPPLRRWGAHSPAAKRVGESQFRRLENKLSTLPTLYSHRYTATLPPQYPPPFQYHQLTPTQSHIPTILELLKDDFNRRLVLYLSWGWGILFGEGGSNRIWKWKDKWTEWQLISSSCLQLIWFCCLLLRLYFLSYLANE